MQITRVRIAVVVNDKGEWASSGYEGARDVDMISLAKECLEPEMVENVYFVEADIPIPIPPTVDGVATKAEKE